MLRPRRRGLIVVVWKRIAAFAGLRNWLILAGQRRKLPACF